MPNQDAHHTCRTCALADWLRTDGGELHPKGQGRCLWVMPKFPISVYFHGPKKLGERPNHLRGSIYYHDITECAAWEAKPDA